ncbi:MAG: hypothetical protein ABMA01_00920 [Chthoniobacteraceae bacterium]
MNVTKMNEPGGDRLESPGACQGDAGQGLPPSLKHGGSIPPGVSVLIRWLVVASLTGLVLFFGLRSSSRFHELPWIPTVVGKYADWYTGTRKLLGFFGFSCAILYVLGNPRSRWLAAALLAFPIGIEILQAVGGSRDGSAGDAAIGFTGAAIALLAARGVARVNACRGEKVTVEAIDEIKNGN